MNWKFWKRKETDIEKLRDGVKNAYKLAASTYATLEYNAYVTQCLRLESLSLLGAIALQHGGEMIVKPEFFEMVEDMHVDLKWLDDGSYVISVTDAPKEEV